MLRTPLWDTNDAARRGSGARVPEHLFRTLELKLRGAKMTESPEQLKLVGLERISGSRNEDGTMNVSIFARDKRTGKPVRKDFQVMKHDETAGEVLRQLSDLGG